MEIALAIVALFPTEVSETYYRPSYRTTPAQGKLYTAYSKYKFQLRESNLISKRTKSIPTESGIQYFNS